MMTDILIIGGGVSGLLTARELVAADAKITLVEMGDTGREASWAGGGILSPLYPWRYSNAVNALAHWSQDVYPELCCALHQETRISPELTTSGLLVLDEEQRDVALAWAEQQGRVIEVQDQAWLEQTEPSLELAVDEVLWMPRVAQIRNPRLTQALRQSIQRRVRIHENEKVIDLIIENGKFQGARTTKRKIKADCAIVCTGAWTAQLLEAIGETPKIRPVRGQMMLFSAAPGQIQHLTLYRERYIIPRQDGRVLIGSTLEEAGFDKSTTAEAKEELYQMAVELYPLLRRTPIEDHWAGLRPGSPSGIPYICTYPTVEGLYLNAGHFRNGLVTGPASARLIADLVLQRPPTLSPEPYRLEAKRD